ncbi:LysR family substrate-binding domain-containing protein [Microbacterium sp. ZW T5_56]|uniref:LysR family substrate-binding domain-containing protein n=1 Tax=Microbacterium sp. ZW T5_56 TaxID=3378081 RepID=UPI0038537E05
MSRSSSRQPSRGGSSRPVTSSGRSGARGSGKPAQKASASGAQKNGTKKSSGAKKSGVVKKGTPPRPVPAPTEPRVFRLGAVPGSTPGKWIRIWRQRFADVTLELVPLTAASQRAALVAGDVDAAIVRLPIEEDDLHVIALYDEIPVVVVAADSALSAGDELRPVDLSGEVLIVPADDVLEVGPIEGTETPRFDPPETTEDAIATVAAGVGIVIVPMSLARLHHRKDVVYRPFVDGPIAPVGFAWHVDRQTPDVDAFIGIIRGRTANSSRG